MWWDGIASTQGSKPDAEQIANREEPDRTPLCLQLLWRQGARRNGRVPCLPFHHKRHGLRIGSGGRPQAWLHVMLSEQTRRHFHSCRAIVGKEETFPSFSARIAAIQPPAGCSKPAHRLASKAQIFYPSLDSFFRSTGGKTLALQPGSCSGCFCQQFATFTQVGAGRSTEGNHRFPGKIIGFHEAVYWPCCNSPPDGITD